MDILQLIASPLFGRLRFCAKIGGIAGLITGTLFGIILWQNQAVAFAPADTFYIGLMLGFAAWLFILLAVGVWMRYGVSAIAFRSLMNALLTSIITVYLCNAILLPGICFIIGLLVGIIIGTFFCYLCNRIK